MRPAALLVCAALYATTTGIACAGEETIHLKDGAGRELTAARCVICHSLDYIPMNAAVMDRAGWEKSIRKMIDRFGAPVSEDEARQILEFLAQQYSR
jgi:cytochrome c5